MRFTVPDTAVILPTRKLIFYTKHWMIRSKNVKIKNIWEFPVKG